MMMMRVIVLDLAVAGSSGDDAYVSIAAAMV
jgi:hypothetical protein